MVAKLFMRSENLLIVKGFYFLFLLSLISFSVPSFSCFSFLNLLVFHFFLCSLSSLFFIPYSFCLSLLSLFLLCPSFLCLFFFFFLSLILFSITFSLLFKLSISPCPGFPSSFFQSFLFVLSKKLKQHITQNICINKPWHLTINKELKDH